MISMNNLATQAVSKLERERKAIPIIKDSEIGAKLKGKHADDAKASLMADATLKVLADFCSQSEDFAKAVIAGGTFGDCMKEASKGLGNYADGAEICKRCVQFYVPGAQVHSQWHVELPTEYTANRTQHKNQQNGFVLDLMDLWD